MTSEQQQQQEQQHPPHHAHTTTTTTTTSIQCHYDVLGVPRDADAATIKKAHRKMALVLHPDKNFGNNNNAADQFRLVQQAYECLSDPSERKWYDQHRDAILKGWSSSSGAQQQQDKVQILFDVVPYHFSGCYSGYGNEEGGFYAVYNMVFSQVYQGEHEGWQSEGNIEDMPLANSLPTDFGNSDTSWEHVCTFYQAWESFASCLKFAWADVYDTKEAPNRRIRRAMEEDNKRARRNERRARNEEVRALVQFCKKRDPRVKAQRERIERERVEKQKEKIQEAKRKKLLAAQAREAWKAENERAMADFEEEDRNKGRVRLADLDDDYDYGGTKRGRKGRRKNRNLYEEGDEDDAEDGGDDATKDAANDDDDDGKQEEETEPALNNEKEETEVDVEDNEEAMISAESVEGSSVDQEDSFPNDFQEESESSEEETESEPEPDFWRCECCRKDFKSEGQMENHMKSKKHKEAFKKFQAKQKKEETVAEELLLEELMLQD